MSLSSNQPLLSNQLPESLDYEFQDNPILSIQQYLRRTANIMNTKIGGYFVPMENANFEQFFTPGTPFVFRNGYRQLFDLVALNSGVIPNDGATHSFAHGITGITTFTRIYGTATTSTPTYLPLPYASNTANNNIEIWFDNTNVNIIVGMAVVSNLTQCYIIGEYLKT